jgi:predicted lipase
MLESRMYDELTMVLAPLAAATYRDDGVPSFQNASGTCQVFHTTVNGMNCFTFEGTTDFEEWVIDLLAVEMPIFEHPSYGPVHLGFYLDIKDAVAFMLATLEPLGWPPFYLNGHSKGAAEAQLAHAELKSAGHPPLATRAYEPPRVGGPGLAAFLVGEDIQWTQTYNARGADLVTMVPVGPTWTHVGPPIRLAVPDTYGIAAKHEIPAVLAALQCAPA